MPALRIIFDAFVASFVPPLQTPGRQRELSPSWQRREMQQFHLGRSFYHTAAYNTRVPNPQTLKL
jgi:hypothetical protein